MKETGRPYVSFGPLRPFVEDLCAVLYRLLPVVGLRISSSKQDDAGELTLAFYLQTPEALPTVEFLYALVEALRRTPFGVKCQVLRYPPIYYRCQFEAKFVVTARYPLGAEAGR